MQCGVARKIKERRVTMKRLLLVSLMTIVVVALILGGCAKPALTPTPTATPTPTPTPTPTGPPIRIGALLHFTGENALLGPPTKASLEYGLDQIGWQVAGRKIELITEDDATNATTGVDKAKKLVNFDKVDVILGPIHGGPAMSVANYISTTGIPQIIVAPKSIGVLKLGSKNVYLPFGTTEGIGYYAGLYAYDKLGYRTATAAIEDFASGHEYVGGTIAAFEKRGGTIIQKQPIKPGTVDFSPNLAAMKQADCVFYWFTPVLAQRFIAQYYAAGLKMPLVISNNGPVFPKALAEIGDSCIGMVGSGSWTKLIDTPLNNAYVENFVKKYGLDLLMIEGVEFYSVLNIYLEAVKITGGDTTPAKINEALHRVKANTPCGVFSFTPEGLGIGDMYITKVVKQGNQYNWAVIEKYDQVKLDMPR